MTPNLEHPPLFWGLALLAAGMDTPFFETVDLPLALTSYADRGLSITILDCTLDGTITYSTHQCTLVHSGTEDSD
jgi:hypothetical protein